MNIRERIAHELVKPRHSAIGQWLLWAITCIAIAWAFLVCVVIISSVVIAIVESWIE